MSVRAVVFDAGETLVNESRLWRMWANWLNIPDHTLFAALGSVLERGEHHHRVFELFRPGFNLELAREQRRISGVPDHFTMADLYPDALPCLDELRARGIRVGIAANQPAEFERAMLGMPVEFVASSALWGVEKPSAAFFARIISEFHLPADSIAYVGDRLDNDVLPALEAGMVAVFLRRGPWGIIHARRAEVRRAHLQLEDLTELYGALQRLAAR